MTNRGGKRNHGGEKIEQLREEIGELRAEIEALKGEGTRPPDKPPDAPPERKPRRLRLIKGGGATVAATWVADHWKPSAAGVVAASATTAALLVLPENPDTGEVRIPPADQRTLTPTTVVASSSRPNARPTQPPSRPSPQAAEQPKPRTGTKTPSPTTATPSPVRSRTAVPTTRTPRRSVTLPTRLPTAGLPNLPTVSAVPTYAVRPPSTIPSLTVPLRPRCEHNTIGVTVTVCVPIRR